MMEVLGVLEKKLCQLLDIIKNLSHKNNSLSGQNESLLKELEGLRVEHVLFAEKIAQQAADIKALEESLQKENIQAGDLQKEKSLAKVVVEDLIRSMDALIELESQR